MDTPAQVCTLRNFATSECIACGAGPNKSTHCDSNSNKNRDSTSNNNNSNNNSNSNNTRSSSSNSNFKGSESNFKDASNTEDSSTVAAVPPVVYTYTIPSLAHTSTAPTLSSSSVTSSSSPLPSPSLSPSAAASFPLTSLLLSSPTPPPPPLPSAAGFEDTFSTEVTPHFFPLAGVTTVREDFTNATDATNYTDVTDVTTLSLEDLVVRATRAGGPDAQPEARIARSVRESELEGTSMVLSNARSEEEEMLRADEIGDFEEWGS
jgi:hypothetical protein